MVPRREALDAFVEGYDDNTLDDAFDFTVHRFAAVEISTRTKSGHYITGHATLQDACDYLSAVDPPYVPHEIIDLDTRRRIEIDQHFCVTPRDAQAVMIVMPRSLARGLWFDLSADFVGRNTQLVRRVRGYVARVLN